MSLKYALLEAHLTPAPNDYVAQVQDIPSNDTNDILAVMAQTGEPLNKGEALAVLNLLSPKSLPKSQKTVKPSIPTYPISPECLIQGSRRVPDGALER